VQPPSVIPKGMTKLCSQPYKWHQHFKRPGIVCSKDKQVDEKQAKGLIIEIKILLFTNLCNTMNFVITFVVVVIW